MILPFKRYLELGKVKKKTPDPEEADSLLKKAKSRMAFIKGLEVDDNSAPFIFEGVYSSVREAAQSLMSIAGYKPYSHEATISFIKEHSKLLDDAGIAEFDRLRKLRTDSEYRAQPITVEDVKDCLDFAKRLVKKIKL